MERHAVSRTYPGRRANTQLIVDVPYTPLNKSAIETVLTKTVATTHMPS